MNLQATLDRVIIQPDAENASSVIIIPEKARKFHDRGTVLAVGPGRRHMDGKIYPTDIKPGDRVLFSKMHAFPVELDGEKLLVMEAGEILAVMAADKEKVALPTYAEQMGNSAATHGTPFSGGMAEN